MIYSDASLLLYNFAPERNYLKVILELKYLNRNLFWYKKLVTMENIT